MNFLKIFTKKKMGRGPGSESVKNQTRKWQNKVDKKKIMIVNAWNINGRWANHTQREKNLNTYLKKARRQKIKTVIIKDSRHSIPDKKYNVAKEIKKRKL